MNIKFLSSITYVYDIYSYGIAEIKEKTISKLQQIL